MSDEIRYAQSQNASDYALRAIGFAFNPSYNPAFNHSSKAKSVIEKIKFIETQIIAGLLYLMAAASRLLDRVRKRSANKQDDVIVGFVNGMPQFTQKSFSPHPYKQIETEESYFLKKGKRYQEYRPYQRYESSSILVETPENMEFTVSELEQIGVLTTKEVLKEIYALATSKYAASPKNTPQLMHFLINIVKKQKLEGNSILGKVLFLLDKTPQGLFQSIRTGNPQQSLRWIDCTFEDIMQKHYAGILEVFSKHQKTNLQATEIAIHTLIPLEISKLLWTSKGILNIWLADSVKHFFLTKKPGLKNYEINLGLNLKALKSNSELQKKLNGIKKPNSSYGLAHRLICITLGLPPSTELTDLHAKQVALGALLSHLRQEAEGECFALFLAIELLVSQQEKCVDDFSMLLQLSKLTRHVENQLEDLPFLLKVEDFSLDLPFEVNQKGQLLMGKNVGGYVWESPGIQAVCHIMRIDDEVQTLLRILGTWASSENSLSLTPRKLIGLLAKEAAEKNGEKVDSLYINGKLAFEAQTHSLLLHAWGNAIAGMAEANAHSYLKKNIISAVEYAIRLFSEEFLWHQPEMLQAMIENIKDELRKKIHLYYDPTVSNQRHSWNNNQTRGAFVLYEKDSNQDPDNWKRIDHQHDFQRFISSIINSTCNTASALHPEQESVWHELKKKCQTTVNTPLFLYMVTRKYQEGFPVGETLSQGYENMKCTPWLNKLGHDARHVLQVYIESQHLPEMKSIRPNDTHHLLETVMRIGESFSARQLEHFEENPYQLLPLRLLNAHALSLMIRPEMVKIWKNKIPIETWIEDHILKVGKKISQTTIKENQRKELIKFATEHLVDKSKSKEFIEITHKIPESCRMSDFRQHLLKAIGIVGKNSEKSTSEISSALDTHVCETLPLHLQKLLKTSLFPFADTNWHEGIHDLHYAFGINPGTEKLEIMKIYDDLSYIEIIDQRITTQTWEYCLNPFKTEFSEEKL